MEDATGRDDGGQAVRAGMAEIGEAVAALVTGACGGAHEDNDGAAASALPALVGVVWERCEAVAKLPKDNRAAVGRALAKVAVQMKDVAREMDEIDTSAAAAAKGNTGNGESCSDEDDEDDDDLDFDVEFGASSPPNHAHNLSAFALRRVVNLALSTVLKLGRCRGGGCGGTAGG